MAPGRRQTGAEATPEPRGDREHMDTVPPPSHSRSTRTVTRQPSAPPLPPTDAELPAGTTLGSGILPHTTAMTEPPGTPQWQEGPGQHGCSCPEPAAQQQAVEGQVAHAYVPTPRTEEAAWAASALTFLLVLLTLAILYTRLHRKFRKSQSLYWAPGDAGQEPISAIIKRRLLSAPGRRKKQQRRQQRRPLLLGASSESSDS